MFRGCRGHVGEHIKYMVYDRHKRPLGCLLFGAAAWKVSAREQFVGWSDHARQARLKFLTNNTRFLILPDWRESTQLVIQWLDAHGRKCNDTLPIYDATMADIDGVFQLLESYLAQIGVGHADFVIFCADGARRYWKRFTALAQKLKINAHAEIIDDTHAKQNLWLLAEKLPKKLGAQKQASLFQEWKNLLWKGRLKDIYDQIRHLDLPTGSGCVESAIRRVINLRLKSPGIFWKRQTAEVMLFLRSTLLCGRWHIMLNNLYRLNRSQFEGCH